MRTVEVDMPRLRRLLRRRTANPWLKSIEIVAVRVSPAGDAWWDPRVTRQAWVYLSPADWGLFSYVGSLRKDAVENLVSTLADILAVRRVELVPARHRPIRPLPGLSSFRKAWSRQGQRL